jgi:hypothetical protein
MEIILFLEVLPLLVVALVEQKIMVRLVVEVLAEDKVKFLLKIQQVLVKELLVKEMLAVLVLVQQVEIIIMVAEAAGDLEVTVVQQLMQQGVEPEDRTVAAEAGAEGYTAPVSAIMYTAVTEALEQSESSGLDQLVNSRLLEQQTNKY